jgi:hypothetical protein
MDLIGLAVAMKGVYKRVADKLGVDPSYVSRVATGFRHSAKIEAELKREVSRVLAAATKRKR